jgi:hypothetical protein
MSITTENTFCSIVNSLKNGGYRLVIQDYSMTPLL